MPEQQEVFTAEEAARYLRVSTTAVYQMLRSGKLKGAKVGISGKAWRIHRKTLEEFLQGQTGYQQSLIEE